MVEDVVEVGEGKGVGAEEDMATIKGTVTTTDMVATKDMETINDLKTTKKMVDGIGIGAGVAVDEAEAGVIVVQGMKEAEGEEVGEVMVEVVGGWAAVGGATWVRQNLGLFGYGHACLTGL